MTKKIIAAISIFIVLAFSYYWFILRTIPSANESIEIPRLEQSVSVTVDANAIPYIEADSMSDLYAAQGYLAARERLFQMDMLRRNANGELAEVFGAAILDSDRFMRTIGIRRNAENECNDLPEDVKSGLEAYCRGVNAYISSHFHSLPLEFTLLAYTPKPWRPADTLAILKYFDYQQDESWQLDNLRQKVEDKIGSSSAKELFKDDWSKSLPLKGNANANVSKNSQQNKIAFSSLANGLNSVFASHKTIPNWGSTALVVMSKVNGVVNTYISCDKHTDFAVPSNWYLCGLKAPGLNVSGASIPGIPGIVIGRNKYIAWGSASLRADVQDIYLEEFKSNLSTFYNSKKDWKEAEAVIEYIPVRFAKDTVQKILITNHGPIILRNNQWGIALAWTGINKCVSSFLNIKDCKTTLETIWKINRASDWQTFSTVLKDYKGSPQIFVFADYSGNIGSHGAGIIPERSSGDGTKIMSGWNGQGDWANKINFEDLPLAFAAVGQNKTSDHSCNYFIAANQKLYSGNGYSLGQQWNSPYRANRLAELLRQAYKDNKNLSLLFLNECQSDCYGNLIPTVSACLNESLSNQNSIDFNKIMTAKQLSSFNKQIKTDSNAATFYEAFCYTVGRRLLEPKLGVEMTKEYFERWPLAITFVEHFLKDKSTYWLPSFEGNFNTFLLATLSHALKDIKISALLSSDNPNKWLWKNVHIARFQHPISRIIPWLAPIFDVGPIGVSGDSNTLNTANVSYDSWPGIFAANSGTTLRTLIDMSDNDKFYQSTAPGQSGHLGSTHRLDLLNAWKNVDLQPIALSSKQVLRQSKNRLMVHNVEGK